MKRQPIVVSYTELSREKALAAFGITNGARVMLSTPPAMQSSASPDFTARAAAEIASRPEPHNRLSVVDGVRSGSPESSNRHPAHVAIVFAGLIRTTEERIVDRVPVDAGIALDERFERVREQIVGPHAREGAAELTDRRADSVTQKCFAHEPNSLSSTSTPIRSVTG